MNPTEYVTVPSDAVGTGAFRAHGARPVGVGVIKE